MTTAAQLQLARAWRELLRRECADGRHMGVEGPRLSETQPGPHCAQLRVVADGGRAQWFTQRLGETLRLVQLASEAHVDPMVLNALWDADEICTIGQGLCARCDEMRCAVEPIVTLSVQSAFGERTSVGMIHDALFAWQEEAASGKFRALRDALTADAAVDAGLPTVQLKIELRMLRPDEYDDVLRDLYALLTRMRDSPSTSGFRVTHVIPIGCVRDVNVSFYASLHTAIADAGVCLPPLPTMHDLSGSEWQWLFDWIDRTKRTPNVETLFLKFEGGTTDTAERLLKTVVAKSASLQRLIVYWMPHSMTADERQCAATALGATLMAAHAHVRLKELELDLGDVTSNDVAAMQRGLEQVGGFPQSETTPPRFESVVWKARDTTEPVIVALLQLLGTVGVHNLRISLESANVWGSPAIRTLTCGTLKGVLEACAGTLRTLHWNYLACDDAFELDSATVWTREPSQLRKLSLNVLEGSDEVAIRTLDSLLARVGGRLTSFSFGAEYSPIGNSLVGALVAHCPRLRQLYVGRADASFYKALAQAMDQGHCALSAFSATVGPDTYAMGPVPLLAALQNPTHGASRTLRSLIVGNVSSGNPQLSGTTRAFVAALAANATLTRATLFGTLDSKTEKQLRSLPRQFAVRLPSARRQLALLSVCKPRDGQQRLAKLPPDVLGAVFAFAGRRVRRYEYSNK